MNDVDQHPNRFYLFHSQYKFIAADTCPCDHRSIYDALTAERKYQVSKGNLQYTTLSQSLLIHDVCVVILSVHIHRES